MWIACVCVHALCRLYMVCTECVCACRCAVCVGMGAVLYAVCEGMLYAGCKRVWMGCSMQVVKGVDCVCVMGCV